MKGEKTLYVLERIAEAVISSGDLFSAFLTAGYGASSGKINKAIDKQYNERVRRSALVREQVLEKQRYYNLISMLKRDNLLKESGGKGNQKFILSEKGKKKLEELKSRYKKRMPETKYLAVKSECATIAIFDIPETERRKRDWLRRALRHLGFRLIQKSVWLGKVKIPKNFLNDLRNLDLIEYIEIFQVTKTGSLKNIRM